MFQKNVAVGHFQSWYSDVKLETVLAETYLIIACYMTSFTFTLPYLQKSKVRKSAVRKNSKLTEEQKKKWLGVLGHEFMSSEESDEETLVVHPLPWRSSYVNKMYDRIDSYCIHKKSSQSKRQMKVRNTGSPSTRTYPAGTPDWAMTTMD